MPSQAEKQRRQALVQNLVEKRQAEEKARMPLSREDLKALFEKVDDSIFEERNGEVNCSCDHTLTVTRQFLRSRSLPEEAIIRWLAEYGGYCDCEVTFNVADSWGERVGYGDEED